MKVIKVAILSLAVSLLYILPASALTAEESLDFQFTFNPSLSISLSSDEIVIDKLMPGNYASSNTIAINVATNNRNGYTLTAEVGDSTNAALANNNLVNTTSNTSFTSLANNASAALSSFNPNYWGYTTTKTLSDSTLYSGLLYNDTTVLNQTVDSAGNSVGKYYGGNLTNFTIGANAGIDQVSGTYSNVISFAIVPNVSIDVTIDSLDYLQDIAKLNTSQSESVIASMNPNQQYTLKDERDEKSYTIAKIGNTVWMTKNLDLAGGTTLNSNTSNIPAGTTYNLPASSTSGFSDNATAYVYNSNSTTCGDGSPCYSYYSYPAATVGTNPNQGDAIYDICPKGWRLPTNAEYNTLKSTYTTGATLTASPFNGVYAGYYSDSSFSYGGSNGYYLSSTANNASYAYSLYSNSSSTNTYSYDKRLGNSVRCVMAPPVAIYTITYNKNTDAAVSNMPSNQTGTLNAQQQPILSAETPTRSGYNFLGWCKTVPTANTNGTDSCSGNTYAPGITYYVNTTGQTEPISITLYAVWQAKHTITISLTGSGATGVTINGTNYTSSATLPSGTYTISGNYSSGYEFNSWSTSGSISVASTSSASTTMTVTGAGTLTLNGKAATYNLVITADSHTTAFSVRAGSTSGTSTSCSKSSNTFTCSSLTYGTNYYLYPTFASGYEFNSYQKTDSATNASLGSTSAVNTYYKMGAGNGAITMTSKSSKLWFQNATSAQCGQTMYDNRGTDAYKNIAYTTATINGLCWMTRNLDLPGGTTLTSSDSNVASNYTLPASSTSGFSSDTTAYVYNSNSTACGENQPCYSYYSYAAATAGTGPSYGNATSDICPKGWRLPTDAELTALKNTYTTGTTLTAAPFYGVYAGNYNNSSFYDGGSYGHYWSSASNAARALSLYFDSSSTNTTGSLKRAGYSIRCVAN